MLETIFVLFNFFSFCVCQYSLRSYGCHKVEVNQATLSIADITGFKMVVFVYLT